MEKVQFNVQNPKYAIRNADGTGWAAPKSLGAARTITLETNASSKSIYGDGVIQCTIINDKGKTGTLAVNVVPIQYEVDMARKIKTANGYAEIKQISEIEHCIYFETCGMGNDDTTGVMQVAVAKTWLYLCTSTRPAESFNQNEDDMNESTFDIPLTVRGLPLLDATGAPYKINGVEVTAWQQTVVPGDAGYETFGDAVVLPKLATATEE